jgi:hypothetical protein
MTTLTREDLEVMAKASHETFIEMLSQNEAPSSPLVFLFGHHPDSKHQISMSMPLPHLGDRQTARRIMVLMAKAINADAYCFISDTWKATLTEQERREFKGEIKDHPKRYDAVVTVANANGIDAVVISHRYDIVENKPTNFRPDGTSDELGLWEMPIMNGVLNHAELVGEGVDELAREVFDLLGSDLGLDYWKCRS